MSSLRVFLLRSVLLLVIAFTMFGCATTNDANATRSAQGGDGIGGTGVDSEPDGIGGTGQQASTDGIGGTGIIGVLGQGAERGSMVVGGLRISFADDVTVEKNGQSTSTESLHIGHVVEVLADGPPTKLSARRIRIADALVGSVAAVDREAREFEILDQTVRLDPDVHAFSKRGPAPVLEAIDQGDRLRVSGLRRDDGTVVATRIEHAAIVESDAVRGPISRKTSSGFTIGELEVDTRDTPTRVRPGQTVFVVGQLVNQTLRASMVQVQPRFPFGVNTAHLVIEGFAASTSQPDRVRIGATTALVDAKTHFERSTTPTSVPGQRVLLTARVTPGGGIQAERVMLIRPDVARPNTPLRNTPPAQTPVPVERPEPPARIHVPARPTIPPRPPTIDRPVRPEPTVRPAVPRPIDTLVRPVVPQAVDIAK